MVLYHSSTAYHVLCAIVHKLCRYRDEEAVLMITEYLFAGSESEAFLRRLKKTGWFKDILPKERQMVRNYLNNERDKDTEIYWDMICTAMQSVSKLCVIPIQDYLGYGNEARMNQPSTLGQNWKWRLKKDEFSKELIQKIKDITMWYGRYYG